MSLKLNPGKGEPTTSESHTHARCIRCINFQGLRQRALQKKFPVPGPLYLVSLPRFLLLSFYLT